MEVQNLPKPEASSLCPNYKLIAGGKGANQAVAALRAGSEVHFTGCVGEDDFGRTLVTELAMTGVNIDGLKSVDAPTGCAAITVNKRGENIVTVASGANLMAKSETLSDLKLKQASYLLLQMEVNRLENFDLVNRAYDLGVPVIMNLAPFHRIPESVLKKLTYAIMNDGEARELMQQEGASVTTPQETATYLQETFGANIIITRAEQGLVAATEEGLWSLKAYEIVTIDKTAAEDGFVGVFAGSLDKGLPFAEALRYGTVGGALSCETVGGQVSFPRLEAIEAVLEKIPHPELNAYHLTKFGT